MWAFPPRQIINILATMLPSPHINLQTIARHGSCHEKRDIYVCRRHVSNIFNIVFINKATNLTIARKFTCLLKSNAKDPFFSSQFSFWNECVSRRNSFEVSNEQKISKQLKKQKCHLHIWVVTLDI
jgi:hypothetical protein